MRSLCPFFERLSAEGGVEVPPLITLINDPEDDVYLKIILKDGDESAARFVGPTRAPPSASSTPP